MNEELIQGKWKHPLSENYRGGECFECDTTGWKQLTRREYEKEIFSWQKGNIPDCICHAVAMRLLQVTSTACSIFGGTCCIVSKVSCGLLSTTIATICLITAESIFLPSWALEKLPCQLSYSDTAEPYCDQCAKGCCECWCTINKIVYYLYKSAIADLGILAMDLMCFPVNVVCGELNNDCVSIQFLNMDSYKRLYEENSGHLFCEWIERIEPSPETEDPNEDPNRINIKKAHQDD